MTTLMPRGYGGIPSYQFSAPNQINNRYYHNRYRRQGTFFAPHHPTYPLYQPPFTPMKGYTSHNIDQSRRTGLGAQMASFFYKLNEQYQHEQYLRRLNKIDRLYSKISTEYQPGMVYEYEKETKYVPYPVYIGQRGTGSAAGGHLGYGYPTTIGYGTSSGAYFGTSTNFFGASNNLTLPPKVRVIFMPTSQSFLQQPYMGPLTMPPFLYNRLSQPLCSFPLPPPLPQLGSLPLTPAVQQMVVQRYSNPVAVLPFASNWQMPQMMMPICPQVPEYQQQRMVSVPEISSFSTVPQSFMPLPVLNFSSFPSVPQSNVSSSVPMQTLPPLAPAPQLYIPASSPPPPPPIMPSNLPMNSQQSSLQLSLPVTNAVPSFTQYSNSNYPSMCRACPPAPPPLSVPIVGHCWIQHCAACHHVSTPASNSNVRPVGERITPLLRYPKVPQYVTDPMPQQYVQTQTPANMGPWLRKTPPLPPGGILISDEYIDRNGSSSRFDHSQGIQTYQPYRSRPKHRSTTLSFKPAFTTNSTEKKSSRSISPRNTNKTNYNSRKQHGSRKSNSVTSTMSSHTSSSGLSDEYQKLTTHSSNNEQQPISQKLNSEARNINLQYNYQPQELHAVYNINRYLKSSSEDSTLASNHDISFDCSPSFFKEHSQTSSPSSILNSIKEENSCEKADDKSTHSFSPLIKQKERLLIIREFRASSPSTISTVSSNMTFSIIDKNPDLISTTNVLKTNELTEDDVQHHPIL